MIEAGSELTVTLGRSIPLLSDPLRTLDFAENWTKAGLTVENFELRMISTDLAFDSYMEGAKRDGMQVVVDPLLDLQGNLVKGVVIEDIAVAKARFHAMSEDSDSDHGTSGSESPRHEERRRPDAEK